MRRVGWIVTQVKRLCVCVCVGRFLSHNISGGTTLAVVEKRCQYCAHHQTQRSKIVALQEME